MAVQPLIATARKPQSLLQRHLIDRAKRTQLRAEVISTIDPAEGFATQLRHRFTCRTATPSRTGVLTAVFVLAVFAYSGGNGVIPQ